MVKNLRLKRIELTIEYNEERKGLYTSINKQARDKLLGAFFVLHNLTTMFCECGITRICMLIIKSGQQNYLHLYTTIRTNEFEKSLSIQFDKIIDLLYYLT